MYKHISSGLYFPGLITQRSMDSSAIIFLFFLLRTRSPQRMRLTVFFLPEVQACLSPAVLPVVAVAVAHAVPL